MASSSHGAAPMEAEAQHGAAQMQQGINTEMQQGINTAHTEMQQGINNDSGPPGLAVPDEVDQVLETVQGLLRPSDLRARDVT